MNRPDPDELLDKLQRDEQKRQRGKLKIFFGASAGVGKTYAMLQAKPPRCSKVSSCCRSRRSNTAVASSASSTSTRRSHASRN